MKRILNAVACILLVASCGPQMRIATDYDRAYNVAAYATFNWAETENIEKGQNPLLYNELNDKRIKEAVTSELLKKGYHLETEDPAAVLHYHIVVNREPYIAEHPGINSDRRRKGQSIYLFKEGTLIIDIMDPKTNNLIWRGYATSVIDEMYTTEKLEELIKKSVFRILEQLPDAEERLNPEFTLEDLLYEGAY